MQPFDRALTRRLSAVLGEDGSRIARPAVNVLVIRGLGALAAFALSIVIARTLGSEVSGYYYLAFTTATVGAVLGKLGLDVAATKFAATAHADQQFDRLRSIGQTAWVLSVGASLFVGAAMFFGADFLANVVFDEPQGEAAIRAAVLLVPAVALLQVQTQLFKAVERPLLATVLRLVGPPATSALLLVLAQPSSAEVALALVLGSFGSWLLVGFVIWSRTLGQNLSRNRRVSARALLRTALPMLTVTALQLVVNWSDVLMLGMFSDAESVGIYSPALQVASVLGFIQYALSAIAFPRFAVLHGERRNDELQRLVRAIARIGAVAALPILVGILVFAVPVMSVFGDAFTRGATALRVLAVGQFVSVSVGALGPLLAMTGHERHYQWTMIGASTLNIALNALLIPPLGMLGAATATASTVVILNLVNAVWVKHTLQIDVNPLTSGEDRRS